MTKTADRVRQVASRLFAERGYDGTSVRAICTEAGANLNAVSYHFGGKQALYASVLRGAGDERLASAQRILGSPARDQAELETRLLLFAEETLAAWLAEPGLLLILFSEMLHGFRNCGADAVASLGEQSHVLIAFLQAAADAGLLRDGVDVDIVAGALLERLNNQAMLADSIQAQYGQSVKDPKYLRHWTRQTIELLLHGAADQSRP